MPTHWLSWHRRHRVEGTEVGDGTEVAEEVEGIEVGEIEGIAVTQCAEVVEGIEVVDAIVSLQRDARDCPLEDAIMESVVIEDVE